VSFIDDEDRVWRARCAKAPDGWPFDADRDDRLTAHRIAVTSSHPGWYYLVSFDRESAERPTEREVALLVSYLDEYKAHWYGDSGYRKAMERRPLDVDGGANGVTFIKYGPDDWGYRRRTWQYGPLYVPQHPRIREAYPDEAPLGPLSLAALMDRIHTIGSDAEPMPRWVEWKAAHPEVFAVDDPVVYARSISGPMSGLVTPPRCRHCRLELSECPGGCSTGTGDRR
jgi:hypothetical protein